MKKQLFVISFFLIVVSTACIDENKDDNEPVIGFQNVNVSDKVQLVREVGSEKALLTVSLEGRWELWECRGNSVINTDVKGSGAGDFELEIDRRKRFIYKFYNTNSYAMISEKHLPLSGGYNFRDLGGIKTTKGLFVKWGKLFRADEMNKLTKDDLTYLESTGLKTVIDFRSDMEISGGMNGLIPPSVDKLPLSVQNVYRLPIEAGNLFAPDILEKIKKGATSEELGESVKDMYVELVSKEEYVTSYKEFFRYVQNPDSLPLCFHCSAGKDRTGIAAMLVLSALDVDREGIMEDYLLSNKYLTGKYDRYLAMFPSMKSLVTVKSDYLDASFVAIDKKYGSMDNFLKFLNVDKDRMAELYLFK